MSIHYPIRGGFVLVDEDDVPMIEEYAWRLFDDKNGHRYAQTTLPGNKTLRMHRLLLGLQPGDPRHADHIDGNGLNNTRANLRAVSRQQNTWNCRPRGKYPKGVWRQAGRWCARIRHNGVAHFLGMFPTLDEAAKAYRDAEMRLRPEFAGNAFNTSAMVAA
jgi:hypothetical protein